MSVVGLFHSPETRQGLKSLANSKSRLKPTQILIFSPHSEDFRYEAGVSEDFRYEAGVSTPAGLR
ncbi:MAG: hypothetical protein EAZ78_21205 [Oscillatoriales cyanobacterium]|nr:MAG: hypothetical protein EAZ78_21205 [Oscillatoriales cyanobacterium]